MADLISNQLLFPTQILFNGICNRCHQILYAQSQPRKGKQLSEIVELPPGFCASLTLDDTQPHLPSPSRGCPEHVFGAMAVSAQLMP